MNLLMFNLKLDLNTPPLSFTNDWVNEFAKHVDELHLVTMEKGVYTVPDNVTVYTVGIGKSVPKWKKIINFYKHLFTILGKHRIDGCFSHMQPIFSMLGGPVLNIKKIPLVTWYAHPEITLVLKLSHFFSNHTVASVYNAYPYKKNKLTVIGQGIDVELFRKIPISGKDQIIRIVYTGRISRVKNIETLIHAVAILKKTGHRNILTTITGNAQTAADLDYLKELQDLVESLDLAPSIVFQKALPRPDLPLFNATADLFVNLTPAGFGDKVAWEAMACEVPTFVANTDFAATLGKYKSLLLFEYGNSIDLSSKIEQFLSLTPIEKVEIGAYLREQVVQMHSLKALPDKVLGLIRRT